MQRKRLVEIYNTKFISPIGTMHLGMTDRGLCCVTWNDSSWYKFLDTAERHFIVNFISGESKFNGIKHELGQYFAGKLKQFTTAVDLFTLTTFQKRVLKAAQAIEYGKVKSYREIANETGCPGASRAVGNALGKNPIPIVIPCHRVIKTDGTLGGFGGGLDIKRYLLRLENVDEKFFKKSESSFNINT